MICYPGYKKEKSLVELYQDAKAVTFSDVFHQSIAQRNRIPCSEHFHIDDFVDIRTYFSEEDNGLGKMALDLLHIAEYCKEKLQKPIIINNWWGLFMYYVKENYVASKVNIQNPGNTFYHTFSLEKIISMIEDKANTKGSGCYNFSGLRTPNCKEYKEKSAHTHGMAIDFRSENMTGKQLFYFAVEHSKELYALGVRRIEHHSIATTWLHVDLKVQPTSKAEIEIVKMAACSMKSYPPVKTDYGESLLFLRPQEEDDKESILNDDKQTKPNPKELLQVPAKYIRVINNAEMVGLINTQSNPPVYEPKHNDPLYRE